MSSIPCSGKTSYANKYFNTLNTVIISSNEIRKNLMGTYEFYEKTNNIAFDTAKDMIKETLLEGLNVVFNAANTNCKHRKSIIKIAKEIGCKTIAIVFLSSLDTCINRNLKRSKERRVSMETILNMQNSIQIESIRKVLPKLNI